MAFPEKVFSLLHYRPSDWGVDLELRAKLAWNLIEKCALVAGKKSEQEDSQGRAVLELATPEEVVTRAFAIADLFVATAIERKDIVALTEEEMEKAFERGGELNRLRSEQEHEWLRKGKD